MAFNCLPLLELTLCVVYEGPIFGGTFHRVGGVLVDSWGWAEDWRFATPFLAIAVICVLPVGAFWTASKRADASGEEAEEEEEVSFVETIQRVSSVFNSTVCSAVVTMAISTVMMNAFYPILGPHMGSRCSSRHALPGEHFPFSYDQDSLMATLIYSFSTITFMPLSLWIGVEADRRGRDFPFLRRVMIAGLLLNMVSYFFLGPINLFGTYVQRSMETPASLILAQLILGVSLAITQIAAFPFLEGVCELAPRNRDSKVLTTEQRIMVASTIYNVTYSVGCALGTMLAGALADSLTFPLTVATLAALNLPAVVLVAVDGMQTGRRGLAIGGLCGAPRAGTGAEKHEEDMLGGSLLDGAPAVQTASNPMLKQRSADPGNSDPPRIQGAAFEEDTDASGRLMGLVLPFCAAVLIGGGAWCLYSAQQRHTQCSAFYQSSWCTNGANAADALGLFVDDASCQLRGFSGVVHADVATAGVSSLTAGTQPEHVCLLMMMNSSTEICTFEMRGGECLC